jgi:hypothetical protein
MRKLFVGILVLAGCAEERDASKRNETNRSLAFDGVTLSVADRDGVLAVDLSSLQSDADASAANEIVDQALLVGTSLQITEGDNYVEVDLSALKDDADADPANELQTLSYDGGSRELAVSDGNAVTIPAQSLALADDGTVSVSDGNSVRVKGFRNTIVLDVEGGSSAAGAALLAAVSGITSPSASNRWLVRLEPGTYDVGGTLIMRSFVDIEGSGRGVTVILGSATAELVRVEAGAELRHVTVRNTFPSNTAVGITLSSAGEARLKDVRVEVPGGDGVHVANGTLIASETEIVAGALGIKCTFGFVRFNRGVVSAMLPFETAAGVSRIFVSHSQAGPFAPTSPAPVCVGSFSPSYVALNAACQ